MTDPWRGVREEASIGLAPIHECARQTGPAGTLPAEECVECRLWLEDLLRRAMAAGVALVDSRTSAWVGTGCNGLAGANASFAAQIERGDHDAWRGDEP